MLQNVSVDVLIRAFYAPNPAGIYTTYTRIDTYRAALLRQVCRLYNLARYVPELSNILYTFNTSNRLSIKLDIRIRILYDRL